MVSSIFPRYYLEVGSTFPDYYFKTFFCFTYFNIILHLFTLFYINISHFKSFYTVLHCFTAFYIVLHCFTASYTVLHCFASFCIPYTLFNIVLHPFCIVLYRFTLFYYIQVYIFRPVRGITATATVYETSKTVLGTQLLNYSIIQLFNYYGIITYLPRYLNPLGKRANLKETKDFTDPG